MAEPAITIQAAHVSRGSNDHPTRWVVHATCPGVGYSRASKPGTAHGTAKYFASPSSGGSAHYTVGVEGLPKLEHSVRESQIAWQAPPNPHSLGMELTAEASYTRAQWLSDEVKPVVLAGADLTAERCPELGIPLVRISVADLLAGRHGICGHVDVSTAWKQSTHWDPGPNFPWDVFMNRVAERDADAHHAKAGPVTAPVSNLPRWRQFPKAAWRPGPWSARGMAGCFLDGKHHGSVAVIQKALNAQGCGPLKVDGYAGPNTRAAWKHWEWLVYGGHALPANDVPNQSTFELLGQASQLFIGGK